MAACSDVGSPSCVVPYSHARSSRSWRRAIVVIRRGSVVRCMQHERLQHGVVQVGGHPRPLVLADARRPLVVEAPQQPTERPARRRSARPPTTTAMAPADAPTPARPPVRLASDTTPATSRTTPTTTCTTRTTEPPTVGRASTAERPDDRDADGDGRRRHHDRRRPATARSLRQTTSTAAVAQPIASSRRHRSRGGSGGDAAPRRLSVDSDGGAAVEHDAEPAGERQQPDGGAHDRRLDAPAVGPAARHAGEDAVRPAGTRRGRARAARRQSLARRPARPSGSPRSALAVLGDRSGTSPMAPAAAVRTVVVVDLAPPPADAAPAPCPATDPTSTTRPSASSAASPRCSPTASTSTRCGCASRSCCWRSSAASASLVYGALWLAFVVGRRPRSTLGPRRRRRSLLVLGLPLAADRGLQLLRRTGRRPRPARRPRRRAVAATPRHCARRRRPASPGPRRRAGDGTPVGRPPPTPAAPGGCRGGHRPPSILGRLTLGIAVVVAAVGALIDQANGGRLHPEQWLGAAAIVCGVGLLVGAFAGTGPVARSFPPSCSPAPASSPGRRPASASSRRALSATRACTSARARRVARIAASTSSSAPWTSRSTARRSAPVTVDARAAIGEVRIWAADDVTVEVRRRRRPRRRRGGRRRTAGRHVHASDPKGTPDVVVLARVGRGEIHVEPYDDRPRRSRPDPPDPPVLGGERIRRRRRRAHAGRAARARPTARP